MTHSPPNPNPDPAPDEHHGLVEDIRHEIEEAVEHVPPRVRWTVRKLVLLGITAFVGLIVLAVVSVALYYMNRTELAAHELTLFLNNTLATRSNVRIEFSDIRGNPLRQVRLVNPRVVFRDDGAPLLEAPWIDLGYSPLSLLRPGNESVDLVVQSPVVRIARDASGGLRLPTWKTSGAIHKGARPRAFGMHLRLTNGTFQFPIKNGRIDGLDLDALLSTGPQSHALVRSLKYRSGPFETRDLDLTGEISAGDSVQFTITRLRTRDLQFSATGGWAKGHRAKAVHIDLDRLSWQWLARVTGNHAFDVPGEAHAQVDARGDSAWLGRFATRLDWDGLAMQGTGAFGWDGTRLRVDPVDAQSGAGNLKGHASWSHAGWDVGGDVVNGEPSQWRAIGIPGWPKGELSGNFEYAVDTRQHVSNGSLVAHVLDSELAGWRADTCEIQASLPGHGDRTFDVAAVRRGGRFGLHGVTVPGGWRGDYHAAGLPLDEWPDGRASGIRGRLADAAGTVEDLHGALSVTGELSGDQTDWLGMHAAHWRLRQVSGALLPAPDLTADASLADIGFLGVHWDSAASPVHLGDKNLDLLSTRVWAGDTLLSLAGRADWTGPTWRLELSRADAASRQFHWVADPPVRFAGDPRGTTFDRLEARDSLATMSIRGRWASPGGSYDWEGRVRALDLAHLGLPPEWGLAGAADGVLSVDGASGDPRWHLTAATRAPAFGGHRGDSLALDVSGSMARVDIGSGAFRIGGGTLEAKGHVTDIATPWPDSLTGTAVLRWLESASSWNGDLKLDGMPIGRVTGLFPSTAGWSGRLSGTVSVAGNPDQPRLETSLSVADLGWHDFNLSRLDLDARYADERVTIVKLRTERDELGSSAEGQVPVRISFRRPSRMLDEPVDVRVRVANGDLRILPRLMPQIGTAGGTVQAELEVRGTGTRPDLEGHARVHGGSFRLAGRSELLEDVSAVIEMRQSHVTLDSLTAREGDHGSLRGKGEAKLEGAGLQSYRFQLSMRDFTASDPGLYAIQFDGDFVVNNGPLVNGQPVPYVTGRAKIQRGVMLIDFANQTEAQQLASTNGPIYWLYKIDITAESNLKWQPPDGDIEFSADLTAEQTLTELRLFGQMNSIRGTYYFLSNRFTVEKADLTFDNVSGVNPTIDAQATTRVLPLGAKDPPHDVTVTITGRAREPSLTFASNPSDWDEDEILRQITVGRFVSGGVAQGDPFDNYLTRAINRTLSAEMSRAFNGYVNEWVLDREQGGLFAGQGEVILGVGSQVTRNLMLRYRQRVPGLGRENTATPTATATSTSFERDLEAEYRLNRFFIVTSELTQRRSLSGSSISTPTAPDFNINLKARWEY